MTAKDAIIPGNNERVVKIHLKNTMRVKPQVNEQDGNFFVKVLS